MHKLNEGQNTAIEKIVNFFYSTGSSFFLLIGQGGVGKTTCINSAINSISLKSSKELKVCFCAPTHKATKVLESMADEFGCKADCKTVFSLLGLVLTSNNELRSTGKMADGSFSDYDVIVVDESSAVTKGVFGHIQQQAVNYPNVKVIFMGDKCQLNPVKEADSVIFSEGLNTYELTEVMRQEEGSPILALATDIRKAQVNPLHKYEYKTNLSKTTENGVLVLNKMDWTNYIKANLELDEYKENSNLFRCLAYTNRRVNALNRSIRHHLYGKTDTPYIVGERVLTKSPIEDDLSLVKVHTDTELEVIRISKKVHPFISSGTYYVWEVDLKSDRLEFVTAYLLHEDSFSDHRDYLNALAESAKSGGSWKNFWAFKDSFSDLQPTHALTVHRAQGSTYTNVFIDLGDIRKCKNPAERLKLEYVAVSRAKENVIIVE